MIRATTAKLLRLWWRRWRNRGGRFVTFQSATARHGTVPSTRRRSSSLYFLFALMVLPFVYWQTLQDVGKHVDLQHERWETLKQAERDDAADLARFDEGRALELARAQYAEVATDATLAPTLSSSEVVRRAGALLVLLLFLGVLLTELSQDALATGSSDIEWLATMPVGLGELFAARLFARTLVSPLSFFWLVPMLLTLALRGGSWWLAPFVTVLAVVPLLLLRAAIQVFLEAALHLRISTSRLRNVKGICAIAGTLLLFLPFCARNLIVDAASHLGPAMPVLEALPTGLVAHALQDIGAWGKGGTAGAWRLLAAACEVALVVMVVVAVTRRLLRDGLVAGGRRDSSRAAPPAIPTGRSLLSPFVRRECKLLLRDFNYLSQALLIPLVFVGFQILNTRGELTAQFESLAAISAFAFAITAYTFQFSCLRALSLERDSLWMLATFPCPLDAVLRAKAKAWSALIAIYPAVVVVLGMRHVSLASIGAGDVAGLAMLAVGVPMFALLFTSLGVISGDTLVSHEERRKTGATQVLSLFLIALYTSVIAQSDPWRCFGVTVITAALTLALWQKAADTLPFLLDPWSPERRRASLADGLGAAIVFFVFQGLFDLLIRMALPLGQADRTLVSYAAAGTIACGLSAAGLWRFESGRIPRFVAPGARRALARGVAAGLILGGLAVGARWLQWNVGAGRHFVAADSAGPFAWLVVLSVVVVPVCEEYIFRGLVFGGLAPLWGWQRAAIASALVFTAVHPLVQAPVSFVIGIATSIVASRGGGLIGPIVAHVICSAMTVASVHWLQC